MGESTCGSSILPEFSSQHPSLMVHFTCSCCLSNYRPLVASTCIGTHMHKYTPHVCLHIQKCIPRHAYHTHKYGNGERKDHNPPLEYLLQLFRSLPEIWSSGFGRPQAVCVPQAAGISSSHPFLSFSLLAPVANKPGENQHFRIGNNESGFHSDENTVGFTPEIRAGTVRPPSVTRHGRVDRQ